MFCQNCGKEVEDTWENCQNCGYQIKGNNEKIKKESKHIFGWIVCIIYVIAFFTNTPFSIRNIFNILCALIACPIFIKAMREKLNIDIKPHMQVIIFFILIAILNIYINVNLPETNTAYSQNGEVKNVVQVAIPDFSLMEKNDIASWCENNNINYKFEEEYSDNIEKGLFIKQSVSANEIVYENSTITIFYSLGKAPTLGEKNALEKAHSYLSFSAFSKEGLIKQLNFEGFSAEEAQYAVDNCGADWNEQAALKAKSYLDFTSFSRSGLIKQLEFEGFTTEQAEYGATAVGY